MQSAETEKVEDIPGWNEKRKDVAKHLIMKYMRRADEDSAEQSKVEGSEREFINAMTVAMSPNMKTPPYDSAKLQNVENELGAPRNVVAAKAGINWFFVHCVLCPKLLCNMHFRLMKNGGVFFLIPLAITTCVITAPLSFMELALGQYTSKQATILFPRMSPIMSGVGYAMFMMRIILAIGVKTEHRLCSLIWELIGSTFFERRNVVCESASSSDCYIPNVCPANEDFYNGACYDVRNLTKFGNALTVEATILLQTRRILRRYIYNDEYNLPIASVRRILGKTPGCHRVDGVMLFFLICFLCSKLGVSKFSKASSFIIFFSFFAVITTFFSFLPSQYYRIFGKYIYLLNNDSSYLFSLDTWIEAVYVSLLLFSIADGSLHSLGASSSFGSNIIKNIIHTISFNAVFVLACTILFGMTTCVGLEFYYRQNRRIDAPVEAIRTMLQKYIQNEDFASPFYYFAVSNPYTKATSAVLVVALTLLSTAAHVLAAEDVLMMLFHFCPSLLKLNSAIVRHCVFSVMFIILSFFYYHVTYTTGIARSYVPLFMALLVLVVWECVCVSWNYTTFRLLVNIRTMGTSASPVITYGQRISVYLHFAWRYVIPAIVLVTAAFGLSRETLLIELSWTSIITVFLCAMPFFHAVKEVASCWHRKGVMPSLFRSTDRWGPLSIQHRKMAEFDEKAARITF